jgi:hypothetical protein
MLVVRRKGSRAGRGRRVAPGEGEKLHIAEFSECALSWRSTAFMKPSAPAMPNAISFLR